MKIVVIDNLEWDSANIADADFQKNQLAWSVSTFNKNIGSVKEELEIVKDDDILKNENIHCYLINVHCAIYRKKNKLEYEKETPFQTQAGVAIYRELLNIYKDSSEKLQVIFFSPYANNSEPLIRKKLENLVLAQLEFLEVPFTWKQVQTKFEQYNKPVFNNASENLLSGYGIHRSQNPTTAKVAVGKKKILFIDDQSNEWEATFSEIFNENALLHLPYKNQTEFRKALANGNVLKEVKNSLSNKSNPSNIILSDFYLNENHEPAKWMNQESIEQISGFNLFHSVKATDKGKGIPYIMHTSSNKIPYYKIFDQQGVDDWIVKDTRPNATAIEKRDNYLLFKKTIETVSKNNIYKKLQDLWENIQKVKNINTNKWWYSPEYDATLIVPITTDGREKMLFAPVNNERSEYCNFTKGDVVSILESSWFAIRRQINSETDYEGDANESERFLATSICNNLGKIAEMLGVRSGAKSFSYLTNFLLQVRNSASHASDNEYFELNDVFICLDYLLYALINCNTLRDFQDAFPDGFIATHKKISEDNYYIFPCGLLWLYLQFYNSEHSKNCNYGREAMKTRIFKLHKTIVNKGVIEEVINQTKDDSKLNGWLGATFKKELKTNTAEIKPTDPLKISIPV